MTNIHVLLVADGRSPIARNWIEMLKGAGFSVSLFSTYPYQLIAGLEDQIAIPVGFSSYAGAQAGGRKQGAKLLRKTITGVFRPLLMRLRAQLTPRLLQRPREKLIEFIDVVRPDIVHALRIPFEGMLCAKLPADIALAVSIWGNDLTLHAESSQQMRELTQRTLGRADALLADAARDINLAKKWDLRDSVPTLVVPGSGGLDLAKITRSQSKADQVVRELDIPRDRPLVINPRGFRPGSVHQDVFFQSIPLVLEKMPKVYFLCPGMRGQPKAERWVKKLGIGHAVKLLPFLTQNDLWALYTAAEIYISLSSHDGSPNSFLEAIASGCYPIVGDIASLREWIISGENGSLVDPRDARAAARVLCGVIGNENLRQYAAKKNRTLIEECADRNVVDDRVTALYQRVV